MPRMTREEAAAFSAGFNAAWTTMAEVAASVADACYKVGAENALRDRGIPLDSAPLCSSIDGEHRWEIRLALRQGADPSATGRKLRKLIEENPEALGLVEWPESEGYHPVQQVIELPPLDQ